MKRALSVFGWLVLSAAAGDVAGASPPSRPNIIFILADDLGWGDLGIYGHQEVLTPNLNALAAQGALFTQFYVNASVCSPTRVALMTGRFPGNLGFHSIVGGDPVENQLFGVPNWLDPEIPTTTKLLQDAGYATALYGKWHMGQVPQAPSINEYGIDDHRTILGPPSGSTWNQDATFRAYSTDLLVDEALRFIDAHRDQPFFINLWALLPHSTLNPTEEQMAPYAAHAPPWPYQGKSTKQIYYGSVTALDAGIGRLLARLDALGLGDDTLIVFASDNGPEDITIGNVAHSGIGSAGPFRGKKRSLYEGGVRVPLIVRWPGRITAGRVDDTSVISGVDFLPTLLGLAGVDPPGGLQLDGEDVSDILLGEPRARTKPQFWEWRLKVIGDPVHRSPRMASRDGDWKLLMNPDSSRVELYDIPRDPGEMNNMAAARPDIVNAMKPELLGWAASLSAGAINPNAGKNDYPWPKCRFQTDRDNDGTIDCNDGCPDDPLKIGPGQCGCGFPDIDSDGDGVANCIDGCPGDPAKCEAGQCGCGFADTDTDGDGTADCADMCPADAPDDSDGDGVCDSADLCPGFDDAAEFDGDGVPDCLDNCPGVPNAAQVDADGDLFGAACDCSDDDPSVYPGAAEINDGRDNQCSGDPGHGLVDETEGNSGFHDAAPLIGRYSWVRQPGAVLHEAARSPTAWFAECVLILREENWDDDEAPPPDVVFYYLNRPVAPYTGSWGRDSSGVERNPACATRAA